MPRGIFVQPILVAQDTTAGNAGSGTVLMLHFAVFVGLVPDQAGDS